jgi:subtilisin family serine protease
VRATYDFTRIERIRNFDLIADPDGSPERAAAINAVVVELQTLPGRAPNAAFAGEARRNLELIARQLEKRLPPDWNLIEPLIFTQGDDGSRLVSDHGTHVAGILGGDWRRRSTTTGDGRPEVLLRGVCHDINLFDLRVIHESNRQSTEFALLAALEFVQFLNARAAGNGPLVHGVNISLSIPHDVRNYGCGATPVCVASDRLASSGVVVVAAAGNRGWNEQELGFGNFVFCSITDPGNAQDVITVGSTHRLKPHMFGVSYFSSRGPTGDGRVKPDLVAPGEQVRGPIRGEADDEMDGTSMAAPFVSGAAAMLIARHRELIGNSERVKRILCDTATDLGREKYFQGHGLVDVLRALQSV